MATTGPDPHPWFAGDLADPWVSAIARALPVGAVVLPCVGDLPEKWPGDLSPRTLVVHRATLTRPDAERLARWKASCGLPPKVVLAWGAYVRQHQWDAWAPWIDVALPEAVAPETVARHLDGAGGRLAPSGRKSAVVVVGGDVAVRETVADGVAAAGYPVTMVRTWAEAPEGVMAVWVAPVLDDDWGRSLSIAARTRPVLTLLGFADRANVARARSLGASACLDLPCDPADLAYVLDRWHFSPRAEGPHAVPPTPVGARMGRSSLAEPRRPA